MKWESRRLFGFTGWKTLMSSWSEWLTLLKTSPPHSPAASSFHNHNLLRSVFSTWSDLHKAQRVGLRWSVAVKEDFNKRGIYSQMKAGGGFSWCMQSWVFLKSSKLYTVVRSFTFREYQNQSAGSLMNFFFKNPFCFAVTWVWPWIKGHRDAACSIIFVSKKLHLVWETSCKDFLFLFLNDPPPSPPDPLLKSTASSQYWWHFVKTS